jgi:hypothetical protein
MRRSRCALTFPPGERERENLPEESLIMAAAKKATKKAAKKK